MRGPDCASAQSDQRILVRSLVSMVITCNILIFLMNSVAEQAATEFVLNVPPTATVIWRRHTHTGDMFSCDKAERVCVYQEIPFFALCHQQWSGRPA